MEILIEKIIFTFLPRFEDYEDLTKLLNDLRSAVVEFDVLGFPVGDDTFGDKLLSHTVVK